MANDEWERWRGATEQRMNAQEERLCSHADRLDSVEDKVGQVLVKLAVPLFIVGIAGPMVGAVIVALITNSLKR